MLKRIGALTALVLLMAATLVCGLFVLTDEVRGWQADVLVLGPMSAYPNQTVGFSVEFTNTGPASLTISSAIYRVDWGNDTASVSLSEDLTLEDGQTANLTGSFVTPDVAPDTYYGNVTVIAKGSLELFATRETYDAPFTVLDAPDLVVSVQASPSGGMAPLDVTFTSTVTGGIGPYAYAWDAGDGSASTAPSFEHRYDAAGEYTARLTVSDNGGASMTENVSVTVEASPLAVSIQASATNGVAPLATTLSSTVSGGIGPYTYSWTTGDGGTFSGESFTYGYHEPGTYTVKVLVTDGAGNTARDLVTVTVLTGSELPSDPVADNGLAIGSVLPIYVFVFVVASAIVVGVMVYHNRTRFRR